MNYRRFKKIEKYFNPGRPSNKIKELYGRDLELQRLKFLISSNSKQVIITGDRGLGKTSLVNVVSQQFKGFFKKKIRLFKCDTNSTFNDILVGLTEKTNYDKVLLNEIKLDSEQYTIGLPFLKGKGKMNTSTKTGNLLSHKANPDSFSKFFQKKNFIFIIDEFDRIQDSTTKIQIVETFRYFSDYASKSKFIICGINIDSNVLLNNHQSALRSTELIKLDTIDNKALFNLIFDGLTALGLKMSEDVLRGIVWISNGVPFFAHYMCHEIATFAYKENIKNIDLQQIDNLFRNNNDNGLFHYCDEEFNMTIETQEYLDRDELFRYLNIKELDTSEKIIRIKKYLIYSLAWLDNFSNTSFIDTFNTLYGENSFNFQPIQVHNIIRPILNSNLIIKKDDTYEFQDYFFKGYVRFKFFQSLIKSNSLKILPVTNNVDATISASARD